MAGGGTHGHLGIIMSQVEFAAVSASPWLEPFNPNAIPIIQPGTTAVDAAQLARMHAECRRIYTNRINVDQALKKLILEAYDNMYTSQLEDYLLQYANRSALDILMHFKQTYGFINPTQLVENYNKMIAPINFQDPIETLFKQIEDGVRYANAGMQPYMEAQYVNIAFLIILNTGAIPDACRDWLTSADNLLRPSGNNALYQALPAVQDITQQMLQSTMNQLPCLLTPDLSLPWPT
jgi:hypothetical protein